MKIVETYTATIYIGTKDTKRIWKDSLPSDAYNICQDYCNTVGLCVTVTPTTYIYSYGNEPGFIIGLINYPRFPSSPEKIKEQSLELAEMLRYHYRQRRCTIVFPDETIMLGDDD
jgi:ferredoxin